MKLATIRTHTGTQAVRLEGDEGVLLPGFDDVDAILEAKALETVGQAGGDRIDIDEADLAPVVRRPSKIVCVGLNYRNHILEMGRELPEYPTLFTKYPESLIGPRDSIELPPESAAIDWEGELAVVIGATLRRAGADEAERGIAGYTVFNDVTARDWQYRSPQWFQGKAWERTSPLGPFLATPEELPADAVMETWVDEELVQSTPIDDLVFNAVELVQYISTIFTLNPGDIIATGTPGGVGHARQPQRYLTDGQILRTTITGLGELINPARAGA